MKEPLKNKKVIFEEKELTNHGSDNESAEDNLIKAEKLKAEEVIKRLKNKNKIYTIKVTGDEKNKDYAYEILLNSDKGFGCSGKEEYYGLRQNIIDLLNEAEIEFEIIKES